MSKITELYRENAIEAARMLLDDSDSFSSSVVNAATNFIRELEANRPDQSARSPDKGAIIAIDVDGPLYAYLSWKGAAILDGGPVPGAMQAIKDYVDGGYQVHIVSSRLSQAGGLDAVSRSLSAWMVEAFPDDAERVMERITFALTKPPALLAIDDRAFVFRGKFPTVDEVKAFRPWRAYDEAVQEQAPSAETVDRGYMMLIMGMVSALALTGLRSDRDGEARRAIEEMQRVFEARDEVFLATLFSNILLENKKDHEFGIF
jgi:hypothetical protein